LSERTTIERLGAQGASLRFIAGELGRSASTISREVRRGMFSADAVGTAYKPYRDPRLRSASTVNDPVYVAAWAQHRAGERAAKSHQPVKMRHDALVAYVVDKLRDGWSPQLICGRLRFHDNPGDSRMLVCPETLYAWIYAPSQAHRRLMDYLPRAHTRRRRAHGRRAHRSTPKGRTPISTRPEPINDRTEFGHWEGDTIIGGTQTVAIRTEIERKTRYLQARLVAGVSSDPALKAQISIFRPLPKAARKSTTCDNGPEHALHATLKKRLGMVTYFARPYHSWERGTNERANGLIRRYWPKRTNFETITNDDLQAVIDEINNRPMAILGYHTPTEAFHTELTKLRSR
jgi:IS30 family transposase